MRMRLARISEDWKRLLFTIATSGSCWRTITGVKTECTQKSRKDVHMQGSLVHAYTYVFCIVKYTNMHRLQTNTSTKYSHKHTNACMDMQTYKHRHTHHAHAHKQETNIHRCKVVNKLAEGFLEGEGWVRCADFTR